MINIISKVAGFVGGKGALAGMATMLLIIATLFIALTVKNNKLLKSEKVVAEQLVELAQCDATIEKQQNVVMDLKAAIDQEALRFAQMRDQMEERRLALLAEKEKEAKARQRADAKLAKQVKREHSRKKGADALNKFMRELFAT